MFIGVPDTEINPKGIGVYHEEDNNLIRSGYYGHYGSIFGYVRT